MESESTVVIRTSFNPLYRMKCPVLDELFRIKPDSSYQRYWLNNMAIISPKISEICRAMKMSFDYEHFKRIE